MGLVFIHLGSCTIRDIGEIPFTGLSLKTKVNLRYISLFLHKPPFSGPYK